MESQNSIIIIGGGLSGLYLAYLLDKEGIPFTLFEASSRFGGRIQTQLGDLGTPLELGATWFSDQHQSLTQLLRTLGIEKYPQYSEGKSLFQTKSFEPPQEFYVPGSEAPSYRIKDGTQAIITTLISALPEECLHLNRKVETITDQGDYLEVLCDDGHLFKGAQAVLCLPPQLVASSIEFFPSLAEDLMQVLPTVQTWMAGSIKFTVEYEKAFWRTKGYSGMLFSHVGIITEMYDHTNYEASKFGFTGFLNGAAANFSQEERRSYVLQHLVEMLGAEAGKPVSYFDKIWTDDYVLGSNPLIPRPHFNNGHPLLQKAYLNKKLYFSGTESSVNFSGYMEGAVQSAFSVFQNLIKSENQA